MTKGEQAKELFLSGYNCSQAVVLAFADEMQLDKELLARLTMGFGGGMSRLREVCGTVSGMTFVISALYPEDKASVYKRVQEAASMFRDKHGSVVCRELLNLDIKGADSPIPSPRTASYYKKRPCPDLVQSAADILENYIKSHPLQNN